MSYSGVPGAGTHTIELQIKNVDDGGGMLASNSSISNRSLFAMEMKR